MALYRIVRKHPPVTDPPVTEQYVSKLRATKRITERQPDIPSDMSRSDQYLEKLLKLIPADVVAAYLTIRSFWLSANTTVLDPLASSVRHWWLPIGGVIVTVILRIFGTAKRPLATSNVQWSVVFASTVSFLTWIFALNDPIFGLTIDPRLSATLLVLVSLLVPLLVTPANN